VSGARPATVGGHDARRLAAGRIGTHPAANHNAIAEALAFHQGIGIEPRHQESIFRIFERLHGVESYPGTGIGLAIVRKGAERMGGGAGVESAPDTGSGFWVDLPVFREGTP